ncbi:TcdA/TcdB pore-forming domain-containing protein [Pseudomonas sp. 6D_7.1_Bac1]|uniref:TcdA/TcdB pore-forming domain-containing protein n=1 Tax=Pseudomonas sp. 6D_7.1_Bac1 TaxID=2971615 RepID=UPI0021C701F6|nr:TcdA/TcdB pore-forming domain-containing protein [Pseudomonas sp. 6D_7.1_Bac1]MCU1751484.1 hypothetical protein [Pseudomonas sp. 6D_7.1_Bac1]
MSELQLSGAMGQRFSQLFSLAEIQVAMKVFSDTPEYEALNRYYVGSSTSRSGSDQLASTLLFQDTLNELIKKRQQPVSAELAGISSRLDDYVVRAKKTIQMLTYAAVEVPKIMHFVWVGGGIGDIQRDYINVWKQVMATEGFGINLWYDADALLAYETNRIIVESAKAHAAISVADIDALTASELGQLYVQRARALKQQMYDAITKATQAGQSADQARIDLLVRAYGQDEAALENLKQRNFKSLKKLQSEGVNLREIRSELSDKPLFDIYEREIAYRGNLAAASDITRLQVGQTVGGLYSDADLLPDFQRFLGGVDVSVFNPQQRIGLTQLILDHNPQFIPGRGKDYSDFRGYIPEQHRTALETFVKSAPALTEVFAPLKDATVVPDGVRVANKNNPLQGPVPSTEPFNGLSNAFFMANPGSAYIGAVMDHIRSNYEFKDWVASEAARQHISPQDKKRFEALIIGEFEKRFGQFSKMSTDELRSASSFVEAIRNYDADGISFGAQSAIAMSGPSAFSDGLRKFVTANAVPGGVKSLSDQIDLFEGFSLATEEETKHSWKDNAKTEHAWLELEQKKAREGKYNAHYKGNVSELLNDQTLAFKQGWPVIEGRPVLLTSVLQQLLDDLGEPFIRVMNDKLSGEVTFNKSFSLGFDERQQILAQPASELPSSVGAESLGNLNEALTRIASGKLPLEQLSPLHRVVFGGLFGATILDNEGFAKAWEAARVLAENTQDRGLAARYELIEQTLRSRSPTAFEVGLKASSSAAQGSRLLKALAFAEPLSVRQWGEHIARIETAAREEYRGSILQRGNPVHQRLFQAGAISAKQLPQELLVRGVGDPGRRCYPLALVMAAALEKGDAAERALIGRLALASLAGDEPETLVLLRTLDDLRTVPMAQFGAKLGVANLAAVMQLLEQKTVSANLMLNTENHSLLVSKVVGQDRISYRFYDPNFGLYGFEKIQDLQQGIEGLLQDRTLAGLYGIEEVTSATFNLIDLSGSSIADRHLPSQVTVGELLSREPIVGGRTVDPWQRHAALRARSLSENARLGRSVAELDGRRWASVIRSASLNLIKSQSLKPEYVPIYETVTPAAEGKWTLSMIDSKDPARTVNVTVDDPRLFEIRNWLRERFESMGKLPPEAAPHEPAAVNTMNAGFAIMALMQTLRHYEGVDKEKSGAPMALAVRMHSYVIYTQLIHGVAADLAGVIQLVRQALLDERLIAQTTSSVLGRTLGRVAGEGVGSVLALVNVGFDIYELATADNAPARTAAAVQLSFDLAGVALAGSAFAVGGTFGAIAGPLAVVVGGIGFGLGALARNYSLILERAQQVGEYVYRLKSAISEGGYTVVSGVVHPMPEAVITALDLRARQVRLGSHQLFRAHRPGLGLPTVEGDLRRAINMRERWGLPEHADLPQGIQAVILPCTPISYFGYDYQLMPGATHRHDLGFDEARELEYNREGERIFWFDPWTPFEYIVYKLFPNYQPTSVKIVLDEQCRSLYVPLIPLEWQGKMSYDIEAVTGQYSLSLSPGVVAVYLSSQRESASLRWVLRATWASDAVVLFEPQGLKIDGVAVQVAVDSEMYLELEQGQLFRVDWSNRRLNLLEQNLPDENDSGALRERLTRLTHEHRLASPYLPLHNLKVPFVDPQWPVHTNAFYEVARERILYARDLPSAVNAEVRLGAVVGDHVYFYHHDQPTLWRVDALTGRVNRRYRLFNPQKDSRIVSCQDVEGAIHVVQQVTDHEDVDYRFDYLLHPDKVELTAVATTVSEELPLNYDVDWQGWNAFLERFNAFEVDNDASVETAGDIKTWEAAIVLSFQVHSRTQTYSAWLRVRDEWFVSSKDLGIQSPILLASSRDDGNSMVFYEAQKKTLWTWLRRPDATTGVLRSLLNDVDSVVAVADGFVAQTVHGLVFDVRNDTLTLRALNEHWLRDRSDWPTALAAVAGQYRVAGLDIVGLSGADGAPLSARYLAQQILLVGSEQGRNVRTVGLTPDEKAVWLFASESGRLLRQPLLTIEQMRALFDRGTQLPRHDLLAPLQHVWRAWSFIEVTALGGGLQGRTREGVILELMDGQPACIVGVNQDFMLARGATQTPEERIAELIAGQPHKPFLTAGEYPLGWFNWYDTIARRLFSSDGRADGQWVTYLGVLHDQACLLYDPIDLLLLSNDKKVWTHRLVACRDRQVLAIYGSEVISELQPMLPDGIDTLVLGCGREGMTCQVAVEDWDRLDCIVVDVARLQYSKNESASELRLQMQKLDNWWVSSSGGHLLLTDPDNGHSLIFRNALGLVTTQRLELGLTLHVQGDYQNFLLEELVQALVGVGEEGQYHELAGMLDLSNEV